MYNNSNNNSSGSYNNNNGYNDNNSSNSYGGRGNNNGGNSYGGGNRGGSSNGAAPHVELYSTKILAGTRTYFLNLKEDRKSNKYLVIKESKRMQDGTFEKHQIIIYQEDFSKLTTGLNDVFSFLQNNGGESSVDQEESEMTEVEPEANP